MTKEEWKHLPLSIFRFTVAPQDLGLLIGLVLKFNISTENFRR